MTRALADYWAERRRKRKPPPLDSHTLKLLAAQRDRCPVCGDQLLSADDEPQSPTEWEQWFMAARRTLRKQHVVEQAVGTDRRAIVLSTRPRLLPAAPRRATTSPALKFQQNLRCPCGLLEPDAWETGTSGCMSSAWLC